MALCPPSLQHRIRRMAAYCRLPEGRGVPDSYDGTDADFEQVLDLIEAGCRRLVAELTDGANAPGPPSWS